MWYHSFWKTTAILLAIALILGLILFGLLFYAQLNQIKGNPVINTTINNTQSGDLISNLIPVSNQKSSETANANINTNGQLTNYTPTADDDPAIGANNGKITIIAFEDFQCPYCAEAEPILRAVLKQYPNDVKLVYRDFPLYTIHAQAKTAALAGECADEQNAFWPWHDLALERQEQLILAPDIFLDWAYELGLNQTSFNDCLTNETYNDEITRDQNAGILAGVTATPTFFINGYKIEGSITKEQWIVLIEALLAE